ncbi:MAG: hypothetical protein AAF197_11635, partial [Pseudomonadota bacterium]
MIKHVKIFVAVSVSLFFCFGMPIVANAEEEPVELIEGFTTPLEAPLPKLGLDAQLLEQLLLLNIGSYAKSWQVAIANAEAAARSSRDPRLARTATYLAFQNQDFATAKNAARLWIELEPNSTDAQNLYSVALLDQGESEALFNFLDEQNRFAPDVLDTHVRQLAGLAIRQSNSQAALDFMSKIIDRFPDSKQVLLSSAFVANTFKKIETAELWLEQSLSLDRDWESAAQYKVEFLNSQSKHEERRKYIESYLQRNKDSIAMRINYAAELTRSREYDLALTELTKVLKEEPRNVQALTYSALINRQEGNLKL